MPFDSSCLLNTCKLTTCVHFSWLNIDGDVMMMMLKLDDTQVWTREKETGKESILISLYIFKTVL